MSLGVTPDIQNADTDDGNNAIAIRGAYNLSRRSVLRDHGFGFARRRGALTLIGTAPDGWGFQYQYPNDCLKAIEIQRPRNSPPIPFKIEQYEDEDNGRVKVILTDQDQAVLVYTVDEDDVTLFDAQFIKMFVAYLAYRCAAVITTRKGAMEEAWNMYQRAKFEAMASDSNEQCPDSPLDAEWIRARGA